MTLPEVSLKDRSALSRLLSIMLGGNHRPKAIFGGVARVIAILGLAALPWITGSAMNIMQDPDGTTTQLSKWAIAGVVAGIVYLVFSFVADRTFARLATDALYTLQTKLFSHIQTLSMGFFFRNPVGELTSRVTNDSEVVALFYEQGVGPIIRAILQITVILVVMLFINVPLTIAALVIVPFLVGSMYFVTKIAAPAFSQLQEKVGAASGFQGETLDGHKVIISSQRQEWA
ncbi:MAG: ABC transporter transmembrane domain-containing protein, partial [Actinomycetia bacterium]|nr:ABC transporter transmembrane domain-containing protein [Actinomycetes bacterium]